MSSGPKKWRIASCFGHWQSVQCRLHEINELYFSELWSKWFQELFNELWYGEWERRFVAFDTAARQIVESVVIVTREKIHCFCTNERIVASLHSLFALNDVIITHFDCEKVPIYSKDMFQNDDTDMCDEMKMQFLRKICVNFRQVAVPCSSVLLYFWNIALEAKAAPFDKQSFEAWPLIQSFACNFNKGQVNRIVWYSNLNFHFKFQRQSDFLYIGAHGSTLLTLNIVRWLNFQRAWLASNTK